MRATCFAVVVLLAGCATVSREARQPIAVTAQTSGASIFVDGREVAQTPASVVVRTDVPVEIQVVAVDGHKFVCRPSATPQAGLVLVQSLLIPLWIGLVTDAWT